MTTALLPVKHIKCRKCGGQLRALQAALLFWIVCDHCEYASVVPDAYKQLVEDYLQCH